MVRDPVAAALKYSIGRAKTRGHGEVTADDLLVGCLHAISRFGTVELGEWVIDLEELGVDWTTVQPKSEVKLGYSRRVVEILDQASALSRLDGAGKIGIDHLLVCFSRDSDGVMGVLRERYGIDSARWRAAVAHLGGATIAESPGEAVPSREKGAEGDYLSPEGAAEFLGVHVQTIRGYIRSGKLPALRVAGERVIRIRRESLESLLEPLDPTN